MAGLYTRGKFLDCGLRRGRAVLSEGRRATIHGCACTAPVHSGRCQAPVAESGMAQAAVSIVRVKQRFTCSLTHVQCFACLFFFRL